jgi:hypothetical protein
MGPRPGPKEKDRHGRKGCRSTLTSIISGTAISGRAQFAQAALMNGAVSLSAVPSSQPRSSEELALPRKRVEIRRCGSHSLLAAWLAMEHGLERERQALHRGMPLRPSPIRGGGRATLYRSPLLYRLLEGVRLSVYPAMGFASSAVRFNGRTLQYTTKAANGGDAVRNSCPVCGSLVFGGDGGQGQFIHDLRRHAG